MVASQQPPFPTLAGLLSKIDALTHRMDSICPAQGSSRRSQSLVSRYVSRKSNYCWYHTKFGDKLHKFFQIVTSLNLRETSFGRSAHVTTFRRFFTKSCTFVKVPVPNTLFMLDTGSSFSIWSHYLWYNKRSQSSANLQAVNSFPIKTYGHISLTLNLILRL